MDKINSKMKLVKKKIIQKITNTESEKSVSKKNIVRYTA